MVFTIYHSHRSDGTWLALCDLYPSWKYESADQDHPGAETSLKRHATRMTRFQHVGWNGRP